jgi:hypothetical protein
MAALARAELESLLRGRKLDVTLTHLRPPAEGRPALPFGWEAFDSALGGGLPRGELSEIAGERSSGRTTLTSLALASATRRGELAAVVDALDRLDVDSLSAVGVHLPHLLWVRGPAASAEAVRAGSARALLSSAVERAIKSFALVLESRAFGLAVCDLADVPPAVLRRFPFTTWFRLARFVEGSSTAALIVAPERLGRSARGVTIALGRGQLAWRGASDRARLLDGIVPRPGHA